MMNLLLHICCGVCLGGPLEDLTRRGVRVQGHFCNPNIHPYAEFKQRMEALRGLAQGMGVPVRYDEGYGLEDFLREVMPNDAGRCERCYRMRLRRTAQAAKETGCDAFSTTLLVSRHQRHEIIRRVGEEIQKESGLAFEYQDWRPLNPKSHEAARNAGIYRQRYCGCIFSEYEALKQQENRRTAR
jgi:hypothetical protein